MTRPSRRRLATLALLAASASAASCVSRPPPPRPTPSRPAPRAESDDFAADLVAAHNASRARAGLPPLVENPTLDRAADGHARDMADRRKMSHRGGDGSSPFDRISRAGYSYRAAGENVAYGFDDVVSVMAGWMKSPGHRRNILGRQYAEVGVGRAIANDGASYWSVTFGTPLGR